LGNLSGLTAVTERERESKNRGGVEREGEETKRWKGRDEVSKRKRDRQTDRQTDREGGRESKRDEMREEV
jgi:hypothetical protein